MEFNIKIYTNSSKEYLHVDSSISVAGLNENLKCFDGIKYST